MDGTKRPVDKTWVPECNVALCGNVIVCAFVLHFSGPLFAYNCLAEKKSYEKKLVSKP